MKISPSIVITVFLLGPTNSKFMSNNKYIYKIFYNLLYHIILYYFDDYNVTNRLNLLHCFIVIFLMIIMFE